jgi:hypothetical protein
VIASRDGGWELISDGKARLNNEASLPGLELRKNSNLLLILLACYSDAHCLPSYEC